MTERTPPVFVVGAGAVGASLAGALRHAGVPVLGLHGRDEQRVRAAAARAGVAGFSGALPASMREAEVVIVAVRDDAVTEVSQGIAAAGVLSESVSLLHCSGSRAARDTFGGLRARARAIGTLHPLRSFASGRITTDLAGTAFGVEGDPPAVQCGRLLVRQLGGRAYDLQPEAMPLYHAAAALASNYVVALFDAACEALAGAGIPRAEAPAALRPLLASTVENLETVGLPAALTGPVARGDAGAVGRHLTALAAHPDIDALYRALAHRAVDIARQRGGAADATLDEIRRLLGQRRST